MVVSFSGAWMCTFPLPNTILSCRDTSLVKHQRLPAWWYVAKAELPRQVLTQAVCQIHRHKQVPYCSDVLYINIHPHPTYCVKPFHTFTQTDMYGKHTAGSHTQTHALRHIHRAVVVCHKLWADVTFSCKGPGHLRTRRGQSDTRLFPFDITLPWLIPKKNLSFFWFYSYTSLLASA